jgi:hypothetical protein
MGAVHHDGRQLRDQNELSVAWSLLNGCKEGFTVAPAAVTRA